MLPILQIGPFVLQTPGLIILGGLWFGILLTEKLASKFKSDARNLNSLILAIMISSIIGARIGYITRYFEAFLNSPGSVFSLNPSLLDPIAGMSIGILAGFIFIKRKNLPFWHTLDAITPLISVMALAFALSNLVSGNAYGAQTSVPWAIYSHGTFRHPSQIYEVFGAGIILWLVSSKIEYSEVGGKTFFLFFVLSASIRIFLEAFRGDSELYVSGIRTPQVHSWIILAICLWGLNRLERGQLN
jgi:phosphatidylglycerol:prolipoprotein diacylglycerol transferase